jgi:MFS family permease
MSAGVPIGFTIGGLLASQIVSVSGWPTIFAVGGVLPLAMVPLLALRLPESVAPRAATRPRNLVAALFQNGLAPSTVLLWAINLLSLLGVYFILLWMPAILHCTGVSQVSRSLSEADGPAAAPKETAKETVARAAVSEGCRM